MRITLTGPFPLPFNPDVDFYDFAFDGGLTLVSQSPTAIVLRGATTGAETTLHGSGLGINLGTGVATGTVTGWTTRAPDGTVVATVTGISWGYAEFVAADRALDNDNEGPIMALLSRQAITVDAAGAVGPTRVLMPEGITSSITFIGSNHRDDFRGSNGNDRFDLAPMPDGMGSFVYGSRGNDTIDYSRIGLNDAWNEIVYHRSPATSITVSIDAPDNSGTVIKSGAGVDTLVNVARVMEAFGGFNIYGTDGNDVFDITTSQSDGLVGIHGGRGVDSYTLNLAQSGTLVRLDFRGNWHEWNQAPQGLNINLGTGVIANDGFGNRETLTRTGEGRLEIHGTRNADVMVGGAGRDSFIPGGGNDTIDGGDGWDRVRYDRNEMTSAVSVDLLAGTATGSWQNVAFQHSLRNIEEIRGTRNFDDTLRGDGGNNWIDGRGGNDLIFGDSGNDTVLGGDGNDTLHGDDGNDVIYGGNGNDVIVGDDGNDAIEGDAGDDTIYGGAGNDWLTGNGGNDLVFGGDGNDTIQMGGGEETLNGGAGDDLVVINVSDFAPNAFILDTDLAAGTSGARGIAQGRDVLISIEAVEVIGHLNARLVGTDGANTLTGGSGNDTIIAGGGNDLIFGGTEANDLRDVIYGGDGNDTAYGGAGNDEIRGDAGNDLLFGDTGADTLIGGTGNDTLNGGSLGDVLSGGDGDDFLNGGFGFDRLNGGAGADTFFHLGVFDHGSDWIQDYNAAEGDVLQFGNAQATRQQFQINIANTPNAGSADVAEAFVIYRPTGQIIWALVDGAGQDEINLRIGADVFDLLG